MHKKKLWWGKTGEYTPLKYLEGTGTGTYTSGQYIDTGLDYFADFEITVKQRESAGMKALGTSTLYCVERENATTNAWRFRNGESTFFATNLLVTDLHTLKWKGGKVYGDGVELGSFTKTSNTGRMYLFGAESTGTTPRINRYPLQISSCRMWNPSTGELVRDYIPVLDKNGTPCMLDRVENKLYYNQGDGDFLYEEWDYTPVDYLESTGTQYIDTGVEVKSSLKCQVEAKYTSRGSTIIGAYDGSNVYVAVFGNSATNIQFFWRPTSVSHSNMAVDIPFDSWVNIELESNKLTANGVSSTWSDVTSPSFDSNLTLFGRIQNGTLYGSSIPIKYAKIWDGATLIRDYIPVVDVNNKCGFYDKCLNIISYSVGSSDFVGHFEENGVDYKVVSYITAEQVPNSPTSTSNCAFIKTGYIPAYSKKTRMKLKAKMQVKTTSYEHFLGGTSVGVSRFVVGQAGGQNKWYFGLGAQNFWLSVLADTDEHIFGLDWKTKTCSIDDETYSFTSSGEYDSTGDFWLNARNNPNYQDANRQGGSDTTYLKFYEDKKLAYNGIPVVRTSDDKAGLFETVQRQFQTTAGTVEYTYTEQEAA